MPAAIGHLLLEEPGNASLDGSGDFLVARLRKERSHMGK
jgi:hypothetical protein